MTKLLSILLLACASFAAQADADFIVREDTVYDQKTDLTWARCSVGTRWANGRCVGVKRTMTFDEAKNLNLGGGWRVPNKDELATLLKRDMQKVFPDTMEGETAYWSSTPNGASLAWLVGFSNGNAYHDGLRGATGAVRLVRGGQ